MGSPTTKDFSELTPIGKFRRLGQLAAAALSVYDIPVRSIQLHSHATNLLYRVDSASGERFILRLASPGWRTLEDLRAEAAWLEALQLDTDIAAPRLIRAANGDPVVTMSSRDVPEPRHATVMTWVDGRSLAYYLTNANLEKMGELFAKLHQHSQAWKPPGGFTTKRFEAYLSRGEPDALFEAGVLDGFRPDVRGIFQSAREWVIREYASLDRRDLRPIHCDLWHGNIKIDHDGLRPFDFEDTIWGYRLHDIAMGMLDLLETVGTARYDPLLASFRSGYERLLDWPGGNLEVLQIGRLLWKTNYVARFVPQALGQMSAVYGQVFQGFESSGRLVLPD